MYRTEMRNAEYLDLRQNDPNIHQKRKKLHKKWQYHDLRNSKYDPLAAVVTLTWPIFTSLYKQLFVEILSKILCHGKWLLFMK